MKGEISNINFNEVKNTEVGNFKNMKPEHEMSVKELISAIKEEFDKVSKNNDKNECEKSEIQDKTSEENKHDIQKKDISELSREYIDDLKTKSECPDTISSDAIDPTKFELQSPEKVAEKREEFDDNKAKLRVEWEQATGREWPKYKEDVINDKGIVVRKAESNYDAHHIQPLQLGGENIASNITPLDVKSHSEIHSSTGSCKRLVDNVKGGN